MNESARRLPTGATIPSVEICSCTYSSSITTPQRRRSNDLIFAIHANDREFFVSEMEAVASERSTFNVTEDLGSLPADTLSLRVLQSTEYKMKQSSPAGFDHASHSEQEMLAHLRSYKTANQIRKRL